MRDDVCKKRFKDLYEEDKLICTMTGFLNKPELKDAGSFCSGDSGGPGIIEDGDDLRLYQVSILYKNINVDYSSS